MFKTAILSAFIFFLGVSAWAQPVQSPGQFSGLSAFNPEISLNGLFAAGYFSESENLNFGGHDPNETGFTLQNLELAIGAGVDPFFRADAFIIYLIEDGESVVEVEEAFFTTLGLPFGLQLMGGQFFTRFGRHNPQHPHSWAFADQPVILNRLFGPDGLRNPGVQVSWLSPLPFFLELTGSIQNANGETSASFLFEEGEEIGGFPVIEQEPHGLDDLIYLTRLKTAWSPRDSLEMVLGTSGLFGPNATGDDNRTGIAGIDFYGKWTPASAKRGFPFVSLQAEALWRSFEAGGFPSAASSEDLRDRGAYLQALWGFAPRWTAGGRVEYSDGGDEGDPLRDRRWRYSPDLTFAPSDFSKMRLQYNLDYAEHLNDKALHAVFFQFEFLIGAHRAHTF